jgi:hypothetical protein
MTTTTAIPEGTLPQVARGAQLLDEVFGPEWVDRIDTDQLSITYTSRCILGQLYRGGAAVDSWAATGAYARALDELSRGASDLTTWADEHGFDVDQRDDDSEEEREIQICEVFDELTAHWRNLILHRRELEPAS